jgi:hypothetical protein
VLRIAHSLDTPIRARPKNPSGAKLCHATNTDDVSEPSYESQIVPLRRGVAPRQKQTGAHSDASSSRPLFFSKYVPKRMGTNPFPVMSHLLKRSLADGIDLMTELIVQ